MKRTERVGAIVGILTQHQTRRTRSITFASYLGRRNPTSAKTYLQRNSCSNDAMELKNQTTAGARRDSFFTDSFEKRREEILGRFCENLSDGGRLLGGGFLYTSDLMFDPELICGNCRAIAEKFCRL